MLTQECSIEIGSDEVDRALAFYIKAFGSSEIVAIEHVPVTDGERLSESSRVDLRIGDVVIALVLRPGVVTRSEDQEPLVLDVSDVSCAMRAAWDAGATIVAGNFDGAGGEPACQLRDPFGREWILRERCSTS